VQTRETTTAHQTQADVALEGRVALLTGAAGELGAAIAAALAARGALVVCADVRSAAAVLDALPHGRGRPLTLDVTDAAGVRTAVAQVAREHGRLDVLVNAAGVAHAPTPLAQMPDAVIERVIDVNLRGVLHCSREAARAMAGQGFGRIVNIASQAGRAGVAGWSVYCASKAAVIAATQSLALELAPHGVTVNAICPGPMRTRMTAGTVRLEAATSGRDEADVLAEQVRAVPLGRLGEPAELGEMVAWIASDACSFTTGASFNLTGGMSVHF
jgi:NAD(P)-dependent dehydrogenase (short-subunit alcohol dehydrogenase family)